MRIKIDFSEAAKHVFQMPQGINLDKLNSIGYELKDIVCEEYFNGADLAGVYIGLSIENEYFEFELIPN